MTQLIARLCQVALISGEIVLRSRRRMHRTSHPVPSDSSLATINALSQSYQVSVTVISLRVFLWLWKLVELTTCLMVPYEYDVLEYLGTLVCKHHGYSAPFDPRPYDFQ